jgi:PrcB C-terminal
MVLAVSSGEKATGGYGIEIAKIEALQPKRVLLITLVDSKPPADAITTQALTQPYHIVKLKRVDLEPTFVVR